MTNTNVLNHDFLSHWLFFQIFLSLSLPLGGHLVFDIVDQCVYIVIVDFFILQLHRVGYHFIQCLHLLLFSRIRLHRLLKLFYLDLALGTAHNVGHSVHHILHLIHCQHRLQPKWYVSYSKVVFWSCASKFLYLIMAFWFLRMFCASIFLLNCVRKNLPLAACFP